MWDKIKWIFSHYKNHLYVLILLIALTPLQTMVQVLLPRLFGATLDYINMNASAFNPVLLAWVKIIGLRLDLSSATSVAAALGLSYIAIGATATVLYIIVQGHRAWMNTRLEWMYRQETFDNITYRGPDFFTRFRTGDLITRMTDDITEDGKLSWFTCSGIFRTYEALLMITFTVAMMISIDPMLTLYAAGPLPVLIVIFFFSSRLLDKRYENLQKKISEFNDVMEACFSGIRVVKAYVKEKAQRGKFTEAMLKRRDAEVATVRVQAVVESLYMYIWQFGIIIVLLSGGYRVINSGLSTGQLGSFVFYIIWLVFPMFDIGSFLVRSRQSIVMVNRLTELENVPPMVIDDGSAGAIDQTRASLSFKDVEFGFDGTEKRIIDNISLEIAEGETIALVGKVGSGKSWLINLIPRLVDPTGGEIRIGDSSLKKFSLADLRSNIGYVPQEPVLFSDTVRNNVLFGREDISEETLNWAIEVAQLAGEIKTFPKGLETQIGTRGMSISGGQKQRLALARALVGQPRILILDDCTSALDSRTEAALWDRLHEVLPDLTALVITHRPDTLENADRIIVLDQGRVVEIGRHDELIDAEGLYARIYMRYQLEEAVKQ